MSRRLRVDAETRLQKQAVYAREADRRAQEIRARRQRELDESQPAILDALDEYRKFREIPDVRLRATGIHIDPPRPLPPSLGGNPWPPGWDRVEQFAYDLRTRRPLGRLVAHKGGSSLNTYLSVLYTLNAQESRAFENGRRTASGQYRGEVPWSVLCGRGRGTARARRERMWRDLEALETAGLVRLGSAGGQRTIEGFVLLAEDGSGEDYAPPGPQDETIVLPDSFFTNGWHLVLRPREIVMLLTVFHAYQRYGGQHEDWMVNGVPLTQSQRWEEYGVSGETYGSLHLLWELGVISVHDPMPTRRQGKFRPPTEEQRAQYEADGHAFSPLPYQLKPEPQGFDKPAVYRLADCLSGAVFTGLGDLDL
ncbi:hypothetical protein AB0E69_13305 [Kribbella sp. NPDC026611]|uniref:hypothetical protein n=1 Tax=Kribbella sp. NPDC026611 TaxID=3154911 RepID=UPI00340C057B